MSAFHQYFYPWLISQVVSLVILFLAIKKPGWTRFIFVFLFFAAGLFNWVTAIRTPEAYLMYADTAIAIYRNFITGWFRDHIQFVIPLIATGQLVIGVLMLLGGKWQRLGCIGIICFLLAIAPLGIGSAFPFSITVSVAAFLVYRNSKKIEQNNKSSRSNS
jgi:hypothetical protein